MKTRILSFAAFVLLLCAAEGAHAETPTQCIAAFERGQSLRGRSMLVEAKREFVRCSQASCPGEVRAECVARADLTASETPSVTFGARTSEGDDVEDLRVSIDGAELRSVSPGQAFDLNPGSHDARVETPGGATAQKHFVVRLGEKLRGIILTLPPQAPRTPSPTTGPEKEDGRSITPWIFGGVAVAALGAFGVLGTLGNDERAETKNRCAPYCSSEDTSSVRALYISADISLLVAAVMGGASIYLFVRH